MADDILQVQDLRNKILRHESVRPEEFEIAVRNIRNLRRAAAGRAPVSKDGTPKKSADELLNEVF